MVFEVFNSETIKYPSIIYISILIFDIFYFFIVNKLWMQYLWIPFLSIGHCLLPIRNAQKSFSTSILFSVLLQILGPATAFINGPSEGNPSLVTSSGAHTQCWFVLLAYANKHALSSQRMPQKHTSLKRK